MFILPKVRTCYLLLALSLCLLAAAHPASAYKWYVEHPTGTPFTTCKVLFNDKTPDTGMANLTQGQHYTWTSGKNGTSPLFYVSGSCEYKMGISTYQARLMMRSCDGTDLQNAISGNIQCSTPQISLKICSKSGNPGVGDYTHGFCPK